MCVLHPVWFASAIGSTPTATQRPGVTVHEAAGAQRANKACRRLLAGPHAIGGHAMRKQRARWPPVIIARASFATSGTATPYHQAADWRQNQWSP